MPRNKSEKRPSLPDDIDERLVLTIVADCLGHFQAGHTGDYIRKARMSELGHRDGQSLFNSLSQRLKDAWGKPAVREYMAQYLEFLHATQSK